MEEEEKKKEGGEEGRNYFLTKFWSEQRLARSRQLRSLQCTLQPLSPLFSRHLVSWQDSQQKQPDNLTEGQLCSDGPSSYPVSRTHLYPVLIAVDLMPLFAQGRAQGVLTASSRSLPAVQLALHGLGQRTVVIEEVLSLRQLTVA